MQQQNPSKKPIAALVSCYVAVHFIYTKLVLHFFELPMRLSVTLQLVSYIVLGTAGIYMYRHILKDGIKLWAENTVKNILLFTGAAVFNILLSNLALLPVMRLNPDYQAINAHSVAELQGKFPAWFLILGLGIMGPIVEEVVFRLIPAFSAKHKRTQILQTAGAAVLFMLMHIGAFTPEELLYNLPLLVTGLLYGAVTLLSKNATIPILLHILNNLPAIIVLCL